MRTKPDPDFILLGSDTPGGTIYLSQPGPDRTTWTAYDLEPDGELSNPRLVFGMSSANWRGLPEVA